MICSPDKLCHALWEGSIMRQRYSSITPAVVRRTAARGLAAALPWQPYGTTVTVPALLDLLLLVAALRSSLSAVVRRYRFGFCHETARQALRANLPPPQRLAEGLVDALHGYLPRAVRRRAWDVALDLHYVPFYGPARTPGVLGGPKKGGTQRFFVYATAVVVQRGQRWCVGLVPVRDTHPEQAVTQLVEQQRARGLRARCLLLDRGFFSGHVIRALQARRLPFVVGVARKGGRASRVNRLFELASGQVTSYAWKTERGRQPVQVTVVAARRRVRGRWRREVYAFEGVGPAGAVRRHARPLLPAVTAAPLRDRDQLPSDEPGQGTDDDQGPAAAAAVVGVGPAAAAGVGVAAAAAGAARHQLAVLAAQRRVAAGGAAGVARRAGATTPPRLQGDPAAAPTGTPV